MDIQESDLDNWCIVFSNGKTLLGRQAPEAFLRRLAPVYDFAYGMHPQTGNMAYAAMPILTMPSIRHIDIPDGAIVLEVKDLGPADRAKVLGALRAADAMEQRLRAAASGIAIARQ